MRWIALVAALVIAGCGTTPQARLVDPDCRTDLPCWLLQFGPPPIPGTTAGPAAAYTDVACSINGWVIACVPDECDCAQIPVLADYDSDGDADLRDFALWQIVAAGDAN